MNDIVFRRYLSLPKQMRRDVAALAIRCAQRVLIKLDKTKHADSVSHITPILLGVSFIRLIEQGLGKITVERDGQVYIRKIDGIEVHRLH